MSDPTPRTPRISYTRATVIRAGAAVRHRWGDQSAGYVEDEVFISSRLLHSIIFTLEPGARFVHSRENPTIFRADIVYVVLEGTLLLMDPEHGQVVEALPGEAIFFRRDTWHNGVNRGLAPARTLEFFAPPPATGASSAYAKQQPYLETITYANDTALGHWPEARSAFDASAALRLIRRSDQHLRLEGDLLLGLIASTEHLTVVQGDLPAGGQSERRVYGGDAALIVTDGALVASIEAADQSESLALESGDALLLPQDHALRLDNAGDSGVTFLLGVAPSYRPDH